MSGVVASPVAREASDPLSPTLSPEGEREKAANPHRGEASLRVGGAMLVLRPSFQALVAAEQELGPLFALVERAAEGRLALGEMVGLFWHCLRPREDGSPKGVTRERLGEAVTEAGLATMTPVLGVLLRQILAGR